jgi:hypothetical protein
LIGDPPRTVVDEIDTLCTGCHDLIDVEASRAALFV